MKVYISIVSLASKLNIYRLITFPNSTIKIHNKNKYINMYVLVVENGTLKINMYILVFKFGKGISTCQYVSVKSWLSQERQLMDMYILNKKGD